MRVLMLVQSIDSYRPGPDGFIVDWVRTMAAKVDKLIVLTYHYNHREKLPINTQVRLISGHNFLTRNFDLFLKTFLLSRKTDVIFAHILEVFGIAAGICGKLTGRKSFFWYCQGYDLSRHFLAKTALFSVDKVLTATTEIRHRYSAEIGRWVKGKILVVGHGIYLPRYAKGKRHVRRGPLRLLYAGRVSPIKDLATLKRAAKLVKAKLNIKSSYAYRDVGKVLRSADLLVVPTLSKSLDKVYLEALACGVPTIGTDVGYPFMAAKFPRLIFKASDEIDLAAKINWITAHPKETAAIIAAAKSFICRNFDLKILINRIVKKL